MSELKKGTFHRPGFPRRYASVLVIIPTYNEESNIGRVIQGVKRAASFTDILVINDGSEDATAAVARRSGASVLDLPFNLGIGGAVQAGIKFAYAHGYPFLVRLDGDGQHNPEDIPRLLGVVMQGKANIAIGSRFCAGTETYRPPLTRRLGIHYFSLLVSTLVGRRITDTTSGFQCLDRRAIECFARYYPQDYPEVEAHITIKKAGLKVAEVPVVMRPRHNGTSSITQARSIYYMFKVTLATLIAFFRARPRLRPTHSSFQELPDGAAITGLGGLGQLIPADDYSGAGS